jgi:hypothetical protein
VLALLPSPPVALSREKTQAQHLQVVPWAGLDTAGALVTGHF